MSRLLLALFAVVSLGLVATSSLARSANQAATFEIDAVHSSIVFRVSHLGVGMQWGRFNDPAGTFTYDGENLSFDITLDVNKVDTANAKRDDHLRGPDFFNTREFPTATFKTTGSKKIADNQYEVTGDLTIRGVTKPVTVVFNKIGEGERRGNFLAGFEGELTINRLEYGVNYAPDGLGQDVKLIIAVEGIRR